VLIYSKYQFAPDFNMYFVVNGQLPNRSNLDIDIFSYICIDVI